MSRYSTFKYGDGTKYGLSTGESLAWGVEVDWEDKGYFTGTNESEWMQGISVVRGRNSFVKTRGQGFEPLKKGRVIVTLNNQGGRYDGWNSDSDLYPYVTYGHDVRVTVRDIENDVTYPVFYGVISNIKVSGYGKKARAKMYIEDTTQYLLDYTARVAIVKGDDPADNISSILDYIDWPARWGRDLEATSDSINFFWADGNKSAMSVINDITSSFLGYFFISNEGEAKYISRTNVETTGIEYDQEELLKDLGNPQPYENNKNVTRIKAHPRTTAATGVIWQLLGDIPSVQPGEANAFTVWANYTYSDAPSPAEDVITPLATTDFLVNTQSDGGGTDITGDCVVTLDDFGDTGLIELTNNNAAVGYITKLQARGDSIYEQNNTDVTYPKDLSTVVQPRELFLDLIWQQDLNVARDLADLVGVFMEELHPYPVIRIENRPELQYTPDLFGIVTANIGYIGLSGESYRVAGIEHKSMTENCQSIQTTLYLEPYISFENFWTFPIEDFGTDTKFGA